MDSNYFSAKLKSKAKLCNILYHIVIDCHKRSRRRAQNDYKHTFLLFGNYFLITQDICYTGLCGRNYLV